MKKQLCAVFAAALLLTGCAAPANASQAETEKAQAQSISALEVPDRFTGDWTGVEGLVTVHADASVELPDVDTIPIATVKRRDFTNEEAEKLITYFCGDAPFYKTVRDLTKAEIQKQIDRYQAIKDGREEATGDLVMYLEDQGEGYLDQEIAYWTGRLKDAPETYIPEPAPHTFGLEELPKDTVYDKEYHEKVKVVQGYAEVDGKNVTIYMRNEPEESPWTTAQSFVEGYGDYNSGKYYELEEGKTPTKCGLTREQAVKMGDELMAALGATDLVCGQVRGIMFTKGLPYVVHDPETGTSTPPVEDREGGYELTYTRTVKGLPIAVTPYNATSREEGAKGSWHYERITVAVADQGVVWFRWDSPYETPSVTSQASRLISFQDAADIFAKMIMVTNQDLLDLNRVNKMTSRHDYQVDQVSLEYIRARDKDNFEEGTLIPVWNFWGIETRSTDEHPDWTYTDEKNVLLTVNALDGSIIDMSLGY